MINWKCKFGMHDITDKREDLYEMPADKITAYIETGYCRKCNKVLWQQINRYDNVKIYHS